MRAIQPRSNGRRCRCSLVSPSSWWRRSTGRMRCVRWSFRGSAGTRPMRRRSVAILGTTISPYLFFWQAEQEIEEAHRHHAKPLCIAPGEASTEFSRIRFDTLTGMGSAISSRWRSFSRLPLRSMRVVSLTLQHSAQAARSPAANRGQFRSRGLFARASSAPGLLAVPVLAGSAAHAVTEAVGLAGQPGRQATRRPALLCDNCR